MNKRWCKCSTLTFLGIAFFNISKFPKLRIHQVFKIWGSRWHPKKYVSVVLYWIKRGIFERGNLPERVCFFMIIYFLCLLGHLPFIVSSHIHLSKKLKKNLCIECIQYYYSIYIQIKFYYVIPLIVPKNNLLNSFSYHYFGNDLI